MNGILQPHYQQKGLASEYYSHGLEYFLGPYKWAIPRDQIGQCDLFLDLTNREISRSAWPNSNIFK